MRIGDLCSYAPKSQLKAGQAIEGAKYMFFTSSADETKRYSDYQLEGEGIIMGTGGNATLHYYSGKYAASTDCVVLLPDERIKCKYLYYFFRANMHVLEAGFKGAGLKHTNKRYIDDICIDDIPDYERQDEVIFVLDSLQGIISKKNEELLLLDELVRSRFVELFGDPLDGTAKYPIHQVGDVANSVDPQPSHRTPPEKEGGIPYVSIKDCNCKTGKIDFDGARKVSRTILEEHLNRYTLHEGDFVIGKIGTIGNPVFVPARDDYTLSANVVLIQPNSELVSPYFLKYSFESDFVKKQFAKAKNSTSQAAFGIQKIRTVEVMNPDLEIQSRFADFVKQIDKSKFRGFSMLTTMKSAYEQQTLIYP